MDTIKRKLNSVGKECFIRDWNLWGLDTLEAVDLLMKRYSYKETGARTRVHCAKWLLRDRATREYSEYRDVVDKVYKPEYKWEMKKKKR